MRDCCPSRYRRNSSPHTIEHDGRDLRLFCAPLAQDPGAASWGDVAIFIEQHRQAHRAATTLNRRVHAVQHVFASLVMERHTLAIHPVKPSHCLRRGRPLPTPLAPDQVRARCAQSTHAMDSARAVLMRRCGLRVRAGARLRRADLDWEQPS